MAEIEHRKKTSHRLSQKPIQKGWQRLAKLIFSGVGRFFWRFFPVNFFALAYFEAKHSRLGKHHTYISTKNHQFGEIYTCRLAESPIRMLEVKV